GFAAKELATRIDDAKPKVMLSASCGLEVGRIVKYKPLLDEAIRLAGHKPEACLILQRPQEDAALVPRRDHDWAKLRDEAIVYAPLLHGCTSILYEGKPVGTPDAGAFWRVIAEHGCVALFTAPTAFRAIKKEDPQGKFLAQHDLGKFRTLFLAGERADPDTVQWAENLLKVPVIDHWWQTETGWAIAGNPVGLGQLPVKYGSASVAMPGYQVDVVDDACKPVEANKIGSIVIKLPLPPGCLPTLWQQDERFKESYLAEFPG